MSLASKKAQTLEILLPSRVGRITTSAGGAQVVRGGNGRAVKIDLPAGKAVFVTLTLG